MSAFRQKAEAQKRFTELTNRIGFRPNVNLRQMNAQQINKVINDLNNKATIRGTTTIAPKISRNRSELIKLIKKIHPNFRSARTDTFSDLGRKYRQYLPKLPFITQLNNGDLINFLKTPVDELSFETTAEAFIKTIKHMSISNDYYLLMSHETEDGLEIISNYKVVNDIESIRKLLEAIDDGIMLEESTGYGSDVELLYSCILYGSKLTLTWFSVDTYRRVHSGAFFKHYNMTKLDLSRYQIFKPNDDSTESDSINCLIYTLMMSDKISTTDLDNLKLSLFHKEIKSRDIKSIAKRLNITIKLRYDPKQSASILNKGCDIEICIGLVDNHYFINESTLITKAALDNYESSKDDVDFPSIHPKKCKQKPMTSYQVINTIFTKYNDSMLSPITLNNVSNKQTVDKLADYDELRAPEICCGCVYDANEIVDCYKSNDEDVECKHYFCQVKSLLENCECKYEAKKHEFRDYGYLSDKKPFRGFFKNPKTDPNNSYEMWFVDTETFIKQKLNYHVANTLCAIKYSEKYDSFKEYQFFGLDCVEQFLKQLKWHSIIYAHNMAFDFRVFIDHLYDLQTPIESGTKLKQIQGKYHSGFYKGKDGKPSKSFIHLLFKDSYSFLPEKLSALPAMLNLPCGDKEVFPYTLINENNFDKAIPLAECRKHIKVGLRKAFTKNALRIGALSKDLMVDMKAYTIHYCLQDTRILAHAFIKFRKQILEVCKLDIVPRLSLPQLADDFLKSKGVYTDCFSVSGISENFISRCCVGGRVMTNSNQKWHIKSKINNNIETTNINSNIGRGSGCSHNTTITVQNHTGYSIINDTKVKHHQATYSKKEIRLLRQALNSGAIMDFDAVSLYPSAMSMMKGYVKGLPKVLDTNQVANFDSLKDSFDAYYVEIEVLSHKIDREFPLLSVKTKSGIRNFTNYIDGQRFHVDNIALEDLIEFQGIDYKIIRGYYFNDGFNTKIVETITFMFNERLRLKKQKNELQNVYKLIMNASYGKLIQKAIKSSKKFVESDNLRKYVAKNHKFVDSYRKINDTLYVIKEDKSIINHFKASHIAANILSMSKRIMNRVICTAEDAGITIYYQDTDSMHLHANAIPILSKAFEDKYQMKLIGKAMLQFHTDFDVHTDDGKKDEDASNIRAVESIFLGKKCYIDKLKYSNKFLNDKYDYHIRVKGIPTQSIKDFDADYVGTYLRLLDGEVLEFDLSAYCPLQIDADYRARKNTKTLSRTLKYN